MCLKCKGKDKRCFCRGHITTFNGAPPKMSKKGKVCNQKGCFGKQFKGGRDVKK